MILTWALYAVVVALLATGAAAGAERALRLYDRPARWVWLGAMCLSAGLPVAYGLALAAGGPPPQPLLPADLPIIELRGLSVPASPGRGSAGLMDALTAAAPWIWALASVGLAGWLVRSKLRLRESQAEWRPASTAFAEGEPVYRTETFGPAVVGFANPRIVLPDWVAEMDDEHRRLVVLHEREHLRCRDPVLLLAGWIFLVLLPWLVPLWWQFRRLRLAIEKDCDRRVVGRTGDARRYGRLLLEAEELSGGLAAPLVTSGSSFLGDRIRSLVETTPPLRGLRAAGGVAALAASLLAATMLPPPGAAAAMAGVEAAERRVVSGPWETAPQVREEVRLAARAREAYPGTAPGDTVLVRVHVTADGSVDGAYLTNGARLRQSLRRAALEVATGLRFDPATRDGEPVPTWVGVRIPFGP